LLQLLNLDKTYQYLLIALAFFMPVSVSLANLLIVFIVILWIVSGNYQKKYNEIRSSKLMISSIVFYLIHAIGMLWTEDLQWGFHILHKMWYFILLWPILFTLVKKEYIRYYLYSFFAALAITEVISYLILFEIIGDFMKASPGHLTPFMSHISFNPFLAFGIYLLLYELLIRKGINKVKFWTYSLLSMAMIFHMFITGGRAGQAMFFAVIAILCFQFFRGQKIKGSIAVMILVPGILFIAYNTSPLFQERVNSAVYEIATYEKNQVASNQSVKSSVGARILFAANSWEIIKNNPFIGVGTGDFPKEYKKINAINSPSGPFATNPHNMFILVTTELGVLGLLSMLSIFYYQVRISREQSNLFFQNVGLALPVLFLIIMWSDSYLLGHFTSLLFVFFGSFLYKDFEKH
jgi:O-antigen ligase